MGMSVSEAKCSVTATEFVRWGEKIRREWNRHGKSEHYMAQVAYECYLFRYYFVAWATSGKGNPGPVAKFHEFLIRFQNGTEPDQPPPTGHTEADLENEKAVSELERSNQLQETKSAFAAMFGGMAAIASGKTSRKTPAQRRKDELLRAKAEAEGEMPPPKPAGRNSRKRGS